MYVGDLIYNFDISSAFAMEMIQSYIKPSTYACIVDLCFALKMLLF